MLVKGWSIICKNNHENIEGEENVPFEKRKDGETLFIAKTWRPMSVIVSWFCIDS